MKLDRTQSAVCLLLSVGPFAMAGSPVSVPSLSKGVSSSVASEASSSALVDPLAISGVAAPGDISGLWLNAKPTLDLRARYELAEQDGKEDANAGTLRGRVGLLSGKWAGFQAFGEYEGTITADKNSYQAASIHGLGQNRAIIADPESHDLNRAWLSWGHADTAIKAGRQRIILNNARHIGNVGWRQNEQTFDAVTASQGFGPTQVQVGYFREVNRIFGSGTPALAGQQDFDGDSFYGLVSYDLGGGAKVAAYGYSLDLANGAGAANSVDTYGAYLSGKYAASDALAFNYYAEYAQQSDGSGSPLDFSTDYFHVKADGGYKGWSLGVGYEQLGSDNGVGFKFPLGTNHAFNGFADKFLGTPGGGLSDAYIYGGTKLPGGVALKLFVHAFGSEGTDFEYGTEYDAVLVKKLSDSMTGIAKFAYYDADEFATDTTKFSIELNYKF